MLQISLLPEAKGIMTGSTKMAGAIWPYRFVTRSLKSLLETYPSFSLDTNTAALNVSLATNPSSPSRYEVHATVLSDSGPPNHVTASYLNGALPSYFGYDNWGPERTDFPQQGAAGAPGKGACPGRTKRVWVGIEGGSRDSRPFVGLLPQSATTRAARNASAGGEWVSAAFDVEGMCFAWLCGRALSQMIASGGSGGQEAAGVPEWFPRSFLVTEQRLASRNVTRREAHRWMYPRMAGMLSWDD